MTELATRPLPLPASHYGSRTDWLYDRIEAALKLIADHQAAQPTLEALAAAAGMSPFHFQRVFTRWVGISPKKFLQHLTLDSAKRRLVAAASVLDAAYAAGLSGPGRLHDLFVTHEAVTPGEFKRRGEGLTIRWGYAPSPFGECLLFLTERGICGLAFVSGDRASVFADMAARWPAARFVEDAPAAAAMAARIFAPAGERGAPLPLHLYGTNFQIRVWEALLRVPEGALVTYSDLAAAIGAPEAARAVGAACGRNPISWLIPCHRAILRNGYIRDYAWGRPRKLAMIGWEASRSDASRSDASRKDPSSDGAAAQEAL